MITMDEILQGAKWTDMVDDQKSNLYQLHYKLNVIRFKYKKPLIISSGFRTPSKHAQIYMDINTARSKKKLKPIPTPEHSWHLWGAAVDIAPNDDFRAWLLKNEYLLDTLDLYVEHFDAVPHAHFQLYAPPSQNRFFYPNVG
jgi:hypothetical protein